MLRKLMRVVLTIVGAIVGYGVFLLARFLLSVSGYEQRLNLSSTQEVAQTVDKRQHTRKCNVLTFQHHSP